LWHPEPAERSCAAGEAAPNGFLISSFMWPPHGIEPREGAELSKRVSVCQRSSQGAKRRSGPHARSEGAISFPATLN